MLKPRGYNREWVTPRAAVVGAGLMGRWHADAVRWAGGRVVFVIDPDPARAEALASRHPGAKVTGDLVDALRRSGREPSDDRVDVVHLCSPPSTHVELASIAIKNGAHVLVEKPLAPTVEATESLLAIGREHGLLICPTHQILFQPGVLRIFRDVAALGQLVHVAYLTCSAGASNASDEARNRIAAEILPHPLSLLARLFDDALGTAEWSSKLLAPGEMRLYGIVGSTSVSVAISMGGRPTLNSLRLIGVRASAHLDLFHGFGVREPGATSRVYKAARPLFLSGATASVALANLVTRTIRSEAAYPGLRELVCRFYLAIQGDAPPPILDWETLAVAKLRDTVLAQMGFGI